MCGGGNEISVGNWVRINASSDEAGVVCHVDHEVSADFFGDFAKAFEIDAQGISGGASNNQFWFGFASEAFHCFVVDFFFVVQTIRNDVEPFA